MSRSETKIFIETSKGLLSLKQISEISGIELPIIRGRYYRGKRGDELFAPKANVPVKLMYEGEMKSLSEISELTGITTEAIYQRYKKRGMLGETLFKPQVHKHKPEYYVGRKYGRLTIKSVFKDEKKNEYRCICECECGATKNANLTCVQSGVTRSCGCLQNEVRGKASITHHLSTTKEHKAWRHIKGRCLNKNSHAYSEYGERGIQICERWKDSFENFYEDMGPAPSSNHSIDRIDVNGNYEPGNCRWATRKEQNRNKRNTAYITYHGETRSLPEWADLLGVSSGKLRRAYNSGADMGKYIDNIRKGHLKRIPYSR